MSEQSKCPRCGETVEAMVAVACPACGAGHHPGCWEASGGSCSAAGCTAPSKPEGEKSGDVTTGEDTATFQCQYCGSPLDPAEAVRCKDCHTPHHEDCWEDYGHCTTYACNCSSYVVAGADFENPDPDRVITIEHVREPFFPPGALARTAKGIAGGILVLAGLAAVTPVILSLGPRSYRGPRKSGDVWPTPPGPPWVAASERFKGTCYGNTNWEKWPFVLEVRRLHRRRKRFWGYLRWPKANSIHLVDGDYRKGVITMNSTKYIRRGSSRSGTLFRWNLKLEVNRNLENAQGTWKNRWGQGKIVLHLRKVPVDRAKATSWLDAVKKEMRASQ